MAHQDSGLEATCRGGSSRDPREPLQGHYSRTRGIC